MGEGVYIVCGGTGGHLAPGIAAAQRLIEAGVPVELVISEREIDSRLLQSYPDLPRRRAAGAPFTLRPLGLLLFVFNSLRGFVSAWRLLHTRPPAVLLAFGGYLSVSYVMAASLRRVPVVLHEANRRAGRSIRFLAGLADRVFLPEGVALPGLEPARLRRLGMPLRREVRHIPREVIRQRLGVPLHAKVLVVTGGSQGAQALNEWVAAHRPSLAADGLWVFLVAGPGKNTLPERVAGESDLGEPVELRTFSFHNSLHELFCCADVVVSRAGAGTLAELVACQAPAILVPYPHAADDHQLANARDLERRGGCVLVPQSALDSLYREVLDLAYNDWMLGRMRENLRRLGTEDAAGRLARFLVKEYLRAAPAAAPAAPPPQPERTSHGPA